MPAIASLGAFVAQSSEPNAVSELPANTPAAVAATPPTSHFAVSQSDCDAAAIAEAIGSIAEASGLGSLIVSEAR